MKKRVLAIMLACLMLVSLLPAGALAAESEIKCPGEGEKHYLNNCDSELIEVVDPKCGVEGYTVYQCACGDLFAADFVAPIHEEHDFVAEEGATCGNEGKQVCVNCGYKIAIDHDFGDATCTEKATCSVCGAEKGEADGHKWAEVPTIDAEPNEEELKPGTAIFTCTVCGAEKPVDILAHDCKEYLSTTWVKGTSATCTEDGLYGYYPCTVCDRHYKADRVTLIEDPVKTPALGHTAPIEKIEYTEDDGFILIPGVDGVELNVELLAGDAEGYIEIVLTDEDGWYVYDENGQPQGIFVEAFNGTYYVGAMSQGSVPSEEGKHSITMQAGCYYMVSFYSETDEVTFTCGYEAVKYDEGDDAYKAPTCTEDGFRSYTCVTCGESIQEVLPAKHTLIIEELRTPTCTTYGWTVYTCALCDWSEVLPERPLGHTERPADEDLPGNFLYGYDANGNPVYGYPNPAPATCANDAYYWWSCEHCGKEFIEEIEGTAGCIEVEVVVPATCKAVGYTFTYCARGEDCDCKSETKTFTNVLELKDATGKVLVSFELDATYMILEYEIFFTAGVDEDAHHYTDETLFVAKEPTCTEAGEYKYWCVDCGAWVIEEIPMLEHELEEETRTVPPTCSEDGLVGYFCSVCDECVIETEILTWDHTLPFYSMEDVESHTGIDHDMTQVYVEGDCEKVGLYRFYCVDCGTSFLVRDENTGSHIKPEGIGPKNPVVITFTRDVTPLDSEPYFAVEFEEFDFDYIQTGYTVKFVDAEGNVLENNRNFAEYNSYWNEVYYQVFDECTLIVEFTIVAVSAIENNSFIAQDATCTEEGWTEQYVCSRCGDLIESEPIEATGHTKVVTNAKADATCTEDGYAEDCWYCSVCGFEYEAETIPATGHVNTEVLYSQKMIEGVQFGFTHIICTDCGYEWIEDYENYCLHENIQPMQEGRVPATCKSTGLLYWFCPDCGIIKEQVLDKLDHVNAKGDNLSLCYTVTDDLHCVNGCDSDITLPEHVMDEGTAYEANCQTVAYIIYACTNEGCTHTNVIEIGDKKADHEFKFDAYVYEDYTTKEVIIGVAYKCANCDETKIENFDGVAFITEIANKIEEAGETITDGNTIKVTISLAGLEDALWGFELDVMYSSNLKFLSGNFVDGANFAGHVYNKDGVISIAGNHIDSSKDYALDGREAVVELFFEVNQEKAGEVAIDVEIVDIANYAGEDVDGIANDATAKTVELMELDGKEGITVFDVLEAFKLMNAEDYNVAADLNKNGEIDALDIAYMYQYMIEQLTYKQIRALK